MDFANIMAITTTLSCVTPSKVAQHDHKGPLFLALVSVSIPLGIGSTHPPPMCHPGTHKDPCTARSPRPHLEESMKLTATPSYKEVCFPGGVAIWLYTVKQPRFTWFSSSFSKHVPGTHANFRGSINVTGDLLPAWFCVCVLV